MESNNWWVTDNFSTPKTESTLTTRLCAGSKTYKGYIRIRPSLAIAKGVKKLINISFTSTNSRPDKSRMIFNGTNSAFIAGNSIATVENIPEYSNINNLPYSDAYKDDLLTPFPSGDSFNSGAQQLYYRIDLTSVQLEADTDYFIYLRCSPDPVPGTSSTYYSVYETMTGSNYSISLIYDDSPAVLYTKQNNSFMPGVPYVKKDNVWKRATAVFTKVNGIWKRSIRSTGTVSGSDHVEEKNAYGTTVVVETYTTEPNDFGTTVVI